VIVGGLVSFGCGGDDSGAPVTATTARSDTTQVGAVPVCELVPVTEIGALVTGRGIATADERTTGARQACFYSSATAGVGAVVAVEDHGDGVVAAFDRHVGEAELAPLAGVGDRAVLLRPGQEFSLVIRQGRHLVLVSIRGVAPSEDEMRRIATRVVELLTPGLA
jgi:hypothetical protein